MIDYAVEFEPKLNGGAGFLVDGMVEAANNIPEGAPIGTIARRPDGEWIAVRRERHWGYRWLKGGPVPSVPVPNPRDADSWPVIYDPTKPEPKEYPYFDELGSTIIIGPDCFGDTERQVICWRGSNYYIGSPPRVSDPTAQQESRACRICNGSGVGYGKVPDGWLETDCAACDATGLAQQEPECSSVSDEYVSAHKPRTPRVVDRLGVEERDAEWTRTEISRDTYIWEFRFRGGVWKLRLLGHRNWTALGPGDEPANGPFTEVIE